MSDPKDPTPKLQTDGAGLPPLPPKKTATGLGGDDDENWPDEFKELKQKLSPEEREELVNYLRDMLGTED